MKIEIKCRYAAKVLFECDAVSLKAAVEKAVEANVSLAYANLADGNLAYANLTRTYLADANLAKIKADYFKVLSVAKNEVVGLYKSLLEMKTVWE